MDTENKDKKLKFDEADSHFEAANLNKFDCLDLKEKNLISTSYETEYIDPADEKVKNVMDNPEVDFNEVLERDPNEIFRNNALKDGHEKLT